jgi:hypothetical protein
MATERPTDAAPAGVDLRKSPFTLQAVEGLPFDEDSDEAKAIREVIEQAEAERSRIGSAVEGARP